MILSSFESSVVLDGTKTVCVFLAHTALFESSVVLDGTKTPSLRNNSHL